MPNSGKPAGLHEAQNHVSLCDANVSAARLQRDERAMKTMLSTLALGIAMTGLAAAPALALSVTNQDDRAHMLMIDRGADETQKKIGPGETLDLSEACGERCGLTAPRGFTKKVSPGDTVSISDGDVFPTNKGNG